MTKRMIACRLLARACLSGLAAQFMSLQAGDYGVAEQRIHAWHRASEVSQRLETIPGIGPIIGHGTGGLDHRPLGVQVGA